MKTQLQCPNCGGYKVKEEYFHVDENGKLIRKIDPGPYWYMVVFFSFLLVFIFGLGIIILIWGIWNYLDNRNKFLRSTLEHYDFECDICGYKWSQNNREC
jgi:hypothetical protein